MGQIYHPIAMIDSQERSVRIGMFWLRETHVTAPPFKHTTAFKIRSQNFHGLILCKIAERDAETTCPYLLAYDEIKIFIPQSLVQSKSICQEVATRQSKSMKHG